MQGDLVLAADDGFFFTGHPTAEAAARAPVYRRAPTGTCPSCRPSAPPSSWRARACARAPRSTTISMLDLGPTAARILGLDLPGAEGEPLVEALADAPAV